MPNDKNNQKPWATKLSVGAQKKPARVEYEELTGPEFNKLKGASKKKRRKAASMYNAMSEPDFYLNRLDKDIRAVVREYGFSISKKPNKTNERFTITAPPKRKDMRPIFSSRLELELATPEFKTVKCGVELIELIYDTKSRIVDSQTDAALYNAVRVASKMQEFMLCRYERETIAGRPKLAVQTPTISEVTRLDINNYVRSLLSSDNEGQNLKANKIYRLISERYGLAPTTTKRYFKGLVDQLIN